MKSVKNLVETRYGSFFVSIVYRARERIYIIAIPAFPGIVTEARSLSEAKKFAKEVIELQCLAAIEEGKIVIDDTRKVYGKFVRSGALALA